MPDPIDILGTIGLFAAPVGVRVLAVAKLLGLYLVKVFVERGRRMHQYQGGTAHRARAERA